MDFCSPSQSPVSGKNPHKTKILSELSKNLNKCRYLDTLSLTLILRLVPSLNQDFPAVTLISQVLLGLRFLTVADKKIKVFGIWHIEAVLNRFWNTSEWLITVSVISVTVCAAGILLYLLIRRKIKVITMIFDGFYAIKIFQCS